MARSNSFAITVSDTRAHYTHSNQSTHYKGAFSIALRKPFKSTDYRYADNKQSYNSAITDTNCVPFESTNQFPVSVANTVTNVVTNVPAFSFANNSSYTCTNQMAATSV
jgi:hypothetical protein